MSNPKALIESLRKAKLKTALFNCLIQTVSYALSITALFFLIFKVPEIFSLTPKAQLCQLNPLFTAWCKLSWSIGLSELLIMLAVFLPILLARQILAYLKINSIKDQVLALELDQKLKTKERLVSWNEIEQSTAGKNEGAAIKEIIFAQISASLSALNVRDLDPLEVSSAQLFNFFLSLLLLLLAISALFFGQTLSSALTNADAQQLIKILEEDQSLPAEVKAAISEVAFNIEQAGLSSETTRESLNKALSAVSQAQKSEHTGNAAEEQKSQQTNEERSAVRLATPTPTCTPTKSPEQKDNKQQEKQTDVQNSAPDKSQSDKTEKEKSQQEQQQKEQQQQNKQSNSEQKKDKDSQGQGGSEQQSGKKDQQQQQDNAQEESEEQQGKQGQGDSQKQDQQQKENPQSGQNQQQAAKEQQNQNKSQQKQQSDQQQNDQQQQAGEQQKNQSESQQSQSGLDKAEQKLDELQSKMEQNKQSAGKDSKEKDSQQQSKAEQKQLSKGDSKQSENQDKSQAEEQKGDAEKGQEQQAEMPKNQQKSDKNPNDTKDGKSSDESKQDIDRNEKLKEATEKELAAEGGGLGDKAKFKEVKVGSEQSEKLDEKYSGESSGETENKDAEIINSKVPLEQLKLSKPEPIQQKTDQAVPLEYKEILK